MSSASDKSHRVVYLRVDGELRARLEHAAAETGQSVNQLVSAALNERFVAQAQSVDQRLAHMEQLLARLDGRHRADSRATKELLGSFVYLFLLYHPELPDANKPPAHASALRRLEKFVRLVTRNLKEGHSLLTIDERAPVPDGLQEAALPSETSSQDAQP